MIEITESASRVITKQLSMQQKPGGGLRIAAAGSGQAGKHDNGDKAQQCAPSACWFSHPPSSPVPDRQERC